MGAHRPLGAALLVSIAIAVPLGVALHLHRGSFVAVNVANIGRALPTLVVIAVGFTFLGIGFTTVMLALVVLAVPPILNAYVAVDEVDRTRSRPRGDGDDAVPGAVASSCRSRCRCSSPGSGPRPSSSSRPRRSPRSPAAAASARSSSTRRPTTSRAGRRRDLRLAARARRRRGARPPAAVVDPAGLKEEVPAFEPDVRPVV